MIPANAMFLASTLNVRMRGVGFVFQLFNLLPALTAAWNVAVPLLIRGAPWEQATARACHSGKSKQPSFADSTQEPRAWVVESDQPRWPAVRAIFSLSARQPQNNMRILESMEHYFHTLLRFVEHDFHSV